MSDNCRVSEVLYVGLCRQIGTPTEVTVRRELSDMEVMINNSLEENRYIGIKTVYSGSYKEDFRLKSSDIDTMIWFFDLKVITNISQSSDYDISKHCIILMEDSDTPPEFVKLQLLSSPPGINMD